MGMQQKLTALGIYIAVILVLYGQTLVLPKSVYKDVEELLKAEKRDPKEDPDFTTRIAGGLHTYKTRTRLKNSNRKHDIGIIK